MNRLHASPNLGWTQHGHVRFPNGQMGEEKVDYQLLVFSL